MGLRKRSILAVCIAASLLLGLVACGGGGDKITIHGTIERVDLGGFNGCDSEAIDWLNWYLGNRSITFYGAKAGEAIGTATSGTNLATTEQGTECLGDAPFEVTLPKEDLYQAVVHTSSGDQTFSVSLDEASKNGDTWTLNVS